MKMLHIYRSSWYNTRD